MKPLAIIGLDPGTTSAYAIIDLKGNLIKTFSAKELPLSTIIEQIIQFCQPIIVAGDKAKTPSLIEEFSRKLGSKIVSPLEDLKKEDKRSLISERMSLHMRAEINNDHEADSLAAALYAYKTLLPKLNKINRYLTEHALLNHREEFSKLALSGNLHFSLLKKIVSGPKMEKEVMHKVLHHDTIPKTSVVKLFQKNLLLQTQNKQLEKVISKHKSYNKSLARETRKYRTSFYSVSKDKNHFKNKTVIRQSEDLKSFKQQITKLQQEIGKLESFIAMTPNFQLVKKLPNLSQKEFARIIDVKKNDVIYVENPDIFSQRVLTHLENLGIVIISPRSNKMLKSKFRQLEHKGFVAETKSFALVDRGIIEKQINDRVLVEDIIREYQRTSRNK
jgi:uncharacterized protein